MLFDFNQVFLIRPSADVTRHAHGAALLGAVVLTDDIPVVEHGKTEIGKVLNRILAGWQRFVDAGVRFGIGAEDEGVLARKLGSACLKIA
jgi:hypothetical protein